MLLVLRLEVLGKRLEGFSARSFNLERLEFLERVGFVHSFNDCVNVTHHFFFQNIGVVRQNLKDTAVMRNGHNIMAELTCLGPALSGRGFISAPNGLII